MRAHRIAIVPALAAIVCSTALTTGPAAAATVPSDFSAATVNGVAHTIQLDWTNTGGDDVVVQMDTAGYPAAGADGTRVYSGTGETATVSTIDDATTYYF